jgi:hypothetical protein
MGLVMIGAIGEIRTPGLLITNQVLYQLSYTGGAPATGQADISESDRSQASPSSSSRSPNLSALASSASITGMRRPASNARQAPPPVLL